MIIRKTQNTERNGRSTAATAITTELQPNDKDDSGGCRRHDHRCQKSTAVTLMKTTMSSTAGPQPQHHFCSKNNSVSEAQDNQHVLSAAAAKKLQDRAPNFASATAHAQTASTNTTTDSRSSRSSTAISACKSTYYSHTAPRPCLSNGLVGRWRGGSHERE